MNFNELADVTEETKWDYAFLCVQYHTKVLVPYLKVNPMGDEIPVIPHRVKLVNVDVLNVDLTYQVPVGDIDNRRDLLNRAQEVTSIMQKTLYESYGDKVPLKIEEFDYTLTRGSFA